MSPSSTFRRFFVQCRRGLGESPRERGLKSSATTLETPFFGFLHGFYWTDQHHFFASKRDFSPKMLQHVEKTLQNQPKWLILKRFLGVLRHFWGKIAF